MVGHSCCHTHTHTHTQSLCAPETRASTIIIFLVEMVGLTPGLQRRRDAAVNVGFDPKPAGARVCFGSEMARLPENWFSLIVAPVLLG